MNKKEFLDILAKKMQITKKQADHFCNVLNATIIESVMKSDGHKFRFMDFGTFSVSFRKARVGINPRTKEKINISAKKVLTFKASKKVAEFVNKKA